MEADWTEDYHTMQCLLISAAGKQPIEVSRNFDTMEKGYAEMVVLPGTRG